jgi:hypothetical protein
MAKVEATDDEQDAKAFRAVFLNGEPLVAPTITAPDQVIEIATQRLHELRARVCAGATRAAAEGRVLA